MSDCCNRPVQEGDGSAMKLMMFIFLLLVASQGVAQGDINVVGFNCYRSGSATEVVRKMTDLIAGRKYTEISLLLSKGSAAEQFLATIVLEKLSTLEQYALTNNEKKLMMKIKNSNLKIEVCSGCTNFDKVRLRKMFVDKDFLGSAECLDSVLVSGKP
ncbi:MAG TPA: hypothetical protein PKL56_03770 [Cyclobacteriaceae bacterium]|nr:hypothetical protein [Cyclobacteriaceae bacterium]HMX00406.1 hypothetical protein [Cyclobacteriaceae bacterium]HMX50510.1 hypothetical protein [Cyclobacteriaceae bacterium]HNE96520.1 hypothetical protein [Cyclobacteriaceae bacterium]HNG41802.1 hypothetical protein [Cyclobacteriaceae bacterium]